MITAAEWKSLYDLAIGEIEDTLSELPEDLAGRAKLLAVTFERVPNPALVGDGIAPDTLGLFTGPEFENEHHVPLPPQIILYLENLWEFSGKDEAVYLDEVRTTYLHELGHYLGLDEDDLFERGLD